MPVRPVLLVLGAVVIALVLFYATRDEPSIALHDSVVAGSHHGRPAEILDNAGIIASRICVFGPYTSADTINEVLGFPWSRASRTGIESAEASNLVVAANAFWVSAWTLAPRSASDFLRPDGYGCAPLVQL